MDDTFKALASEPRRRILNHLSGGPRYLLKKRMTARQLSVVALQ